MNTLSTPKGALTHCAFVILIAVFLTNAAVAAPLTVHLTGGFTNQAFIIDYGDGTYDDITVSATVDLVLTPSQPACNATNFASSTAQVTGTIRIWGTAIYYAPSPSLTENFDNTYNYGAIQVSAPIGYEGQTGQGAVQDLYWQIATTRDHDRAIPYRLHYYGDTHLLRLWISLPHPFWYSQNDEYYDTAGKATVSGQETVRSCLDGVVTNAVNGQPIAGASVRFGNVPQTTDQNGGFHYTGVPANTFQLIVTNSGYDPYTNLLAIPAFTIVRTNAPLVPTRVPVILVHGYHGKTNTWTNLMAILEARKIPYRAVDYWPANGDPRLYAGKVAAAVESYREAGYTGKVDIVCHSMGALVSRYYMECKGGGKNVRQWIGIGPVNQGAALANYPGDYLGLLAWLASTVVEDVRHDGAITQMRTDSETVTSLNTSGRAPDVVYRIITGYNGCAWPYNWTNGECICREDLSKDFRNPFFSGGKTVARITDERGVVHPHAWTYYGDVLVALVQSALPGARSMDCFTNIGHNTLPQHPSVLTQVVKYLEDPTAESLNNFPSIEDLRRDADVQTIGAGNQGILFMGQQHTQTIPVDSSVARMTASVTYHGSQLGLTLFTPSGEPLLPGHYPVLQYSNAINSVWYVVDTPAPGIWNARIDAIDVPSTGEPFALQVSFSSPQELLVGAQTGGRPVHPGQPVLVWADFHNGTNPITGGLVYAEISKSGGQTHQINLYDNATHGDVAPGDGIYSADYTPDSPGWYAFMFTAKAGLVERVETLHLEVEPLLAGPVLAARIAAPWVGTHMDRSRRGVSPRERPNTIRPPLVC